SLRAKVISVIINKLVFKPGLSLSEFIDADLLKGVFRLDVFQSMRKHVGKFFHHSHLQQLMEFPVLFLGAMPDKIPALYSLMNFADIKGGTWFPAGGIYSIVQAMHTLAEENGAAFQFNEDVTEIVLKGSTASAVKTAAGNLYEADAVLGAADYHFVETKLLPPDYRTYTDDYWNSRIMAPSCLLYYVGINKKLKNVLHHSLFFDTSFEQHGKEIYETKQWPQDPLFYVSATSVTDDSTAPQGCENLFFLIPAAAGLTNDSEELREHFFQLIVKRFEERTGEKISDSIIFKKSFAQSDFINEYNAFKGNAYGLANTLLQTAILKPKCRSKKVKNLFFAGQLTVPGPGVPPSIISGEVTAKQIQKFFAE
ncbi:MAG TPA: phytoene desaturase family protein, partial [Chitinophagaceae bacterium]|nr:phytoene desaturase family protein [Chitinophagaceae bacterium]